MCREDDDRRTRQPPAFTEIVEDLPPFPVGEAEVEEDEIRIVVRELGARLGDARCRDDVVSLRSQDDFDHEDDVGLVVDYQDATGQLASPFVSALRTWAPGS